MWLLQSSLRNKQYTVLHVGAGGAAVKIAVTDDMLPVAVVFNINNVAASVATDKLESFHSKVDCFSALLGRVYLLDAGEAIREAVVELGSGQFSLAASATDDISHVTLQTEGEGWSGLKGFCLSMESIVLAFVVLVQSILE